MISSISANTVTIILHGRKFIHIKYNITIRARGYDVFFFFYSTQRLYSVRAILYYNCLMNNNDAITINY